MTYGSMRPKQEGQVFNKDIDIGSTIAELCFCMTKLKLEGWSNTSEVRLVASTNCTFKMPVPLTARAPGQRWQVACSSGNIALLPSRYSIGFAAVSNKAA